MRTIFSSALVALVLLVATTANAERRTAFRVGETYEITKIRDSTSEGPNGSSGSSHDEDTLIERVEAVRPDGVELVFDLPQGTTAEERRQTWQFPARVFEPFEGTAKLLNAPELEQRVDDWLKWGKMTRQACGHWIFTWNAFRIECDPQSVIAEVQTFDPPLPELRNGGVYRDPNALAAAQLTKKSADSAGSTFAASMAINPKVVQHDRAQADVVTGEITRKPVTLEAAFAERAKEAVSGTIEVTIDVDASGNWSRLTKVAKSKTEKPDGNVESETVTETLQRRLISPRKP
jgi:hypothetical protein